MLWVFRRHKDGGYVKEKLGKFLRRKENCPPYVAGFSPPQKKNNKLKKRLYLFLDGVEDHSARGGGKTHRILRGTTKGYWQILKIQFNHTRADHNEFTYGTKGTVLFITVSNFDSWTFQ